MNNVVKLDSRSACPDLTTLEEVLDELSRFGKVIMWKGDRGWTCNISMFIQGDGITFEFTSESIHGKPFGASTQCLDLMRIALRDI